MSKTPESPQLSAEGRHSCDQRKVRQAQALRENLKRRKAQVKARAAEDVPGSPPPPSPAPDTP